MNEDFLDVTFFVGFLHERQKGAETITLIYETRGEGFEATLKYEATFLYVYISHGILMVLLRRFIFRYLYRYSFTFEIQII